ncbi:MAG: DUF1080 domain-containing protein, partial [Verrucomicrobia bacterium]|nr:DUF1080 domain-containing protein [Verrucomicrobiota bacterium]
MSFFDITSEPSRWARSGLLLLGGLLALDQTRAQLAPPPPPLKTSIIISNGKSLAGWRSPLGDWKLVRNAAPSPENPKAFTLAEGKGVLVNGDKGRTGNVFSKHEHGDVMVAIEFMVPQDSNSGIYFQGRYEIQ